MHHESIYKPTQNNLAGGNFTEAMAVNKAMHEQAIHPAGAQANWATPGVSQNWGANVTGANWGATGTGTKAGMNQKFGAQEILQVHQVLTHHIDGINQFELYRPHVKDQQLMSILDKQLQHMSNSYDNIVSYLHNQGKSAAVPYRMKKSFQPQYGLRQPAPNQPNMDVNQMNDQDVASGIMGCAKAGAVLCTNAALECADPNLRSMMINCTVSAVNQAYEVFQYMNQKGMYQLPTLQDNTTNTMMNSYQTVGNIQPGNNIQPGGSGQFQ